MKRLIVNGTRQLIKIYQAIFIPYQIQKRCAKCAFDYKRFDFDSFRLRILDYIETLQVSDGSPQYFYSASVSKPTLYASAYACMTRGMLGSLDQLSQTSKTEWMQYFDSFQNQDDGLFYDPVVRNALFDDSDWWGARHLALHMISAYTALDGKPKHPFYFLKQYYSRAAIENWLSSYDWSSKEVGREDPDNKIMNIGCLLQYQRDAWDDLDAGESVSYLKGYLRKKLNNETGMWGGFDVNNPHERSRIVQFAYHLFPIFFYDDEFDFDAEKIVGITLATQNRFGGFGVQPNSSACEDIDSIDLLIRFYPFVSDQLRAEINDSLAKAFAWVLLNQVDDGGFVFRLNEAFRYGSDNTSSLPNEGAMLPTWFRTLSLAYMARFLGLTNNFVITRCPGYEF